MDRVAKSKNKNWSEEEGGIKETQPALGWLLLLLLLLLPW
jgi:hypothetical protein